VVWDACASLGSEEVVGRGGEERCGRLMAGGADVAEVDDSVHAVDCLVKTVTGAQVTPCTRHSPSDERWLARRVRTRAW